MQKLLIADCNEEFRLLLAEALRDRFQVTLCGAGSEALELIRRDPPDLLALDLMLPEVDGLTLLERTAAAGLFPTVLVFDPLLSNYIAESAHRLGISYAMRKPCEIAAVVQRLIDLSQTRPPAPKKPSPEGITAKLLISLNFRPSHDGYQYLCKAIPMVATDPGQKITKEVYPAIAKIFGCTSQNVERSIRSAIEVAWNHRDPQIWQHYFSHSTKKPTSSVLISTLVRQLPPSTE